MLQRGKGLISQRVDRKIYTIYTEDLGPFVCTVILYCTRAFNSTHPHSWWARWGKKIMACRKINSGLPFSRQTQNPLRRILLTATHPKSLAATYVPGRARDLRLHLELGPPHPGAGATTRARAPPWRLGRTIEPGWGRTLEQGPDPLELGSHPRAGAAPYSWGRTFSWAAP